MREGAANGNRAHQLEPESFVVPFKLRHGPGPATPYMHAHPDLTRSSPTSTHVLLQSSSAVQTFGDAA
jgi:hypothetical protein